MQTMKQLLQPVVLFCLVLFTISASAQDAVKIMAHKFSFTSYNSAGILLGQSNPQLSLQSVNGVQYGPWFAGVGVGLDYYYMRSVPVFIDLRRLIIPKKNLYLYADAGVNYPYLKKPKEEEMWYNAEHQQGLYLDGGLGYLFSAEKQTGFFSIGYSTKRLRETIEHAYIWGPPDRPVQKDNLRYQFNRVIVKAGLRF
jgi:hypothetical protein